jgi:hypothetical protein
LFRQNREERHVASLRLCERFFTIVARLHLPIVIPQLNRIVAVQECGVRKAEKGYKAGYIINLSSLFLTLFILNKTFILQKNADEEYFYNI